MYTVIDIGCRNGPRPQWLRPDVRIIGFDPDPAECARLADEFKPHVFFAQALGGSNGLHTFYQTENNECGSFLKPRQDILDRFGAHRITGTAELSTVTLDDYCERHSVWPDLLKVDTQGTERSILMAAPRVLQSCAVVITEVEFNPLYEGQPLFGDVDRFMRTVGFELRALKDINYVAGQIWWADAHYFRPGMNTVALDLDPV